MTLQSSSRSFCLYLNEKKIIIFAVYRFFGPMFAICPSSFFPHFIIFVEQLFSKEIVDCSVWFDFACFISCLSKPHASSSFRIFSFTHAYACVLVYVCVCSAHSVHTIDHIPFMYSLLFICLQSQKKHPCYGITSAFLLSSCLIVSTVRDRLRLSSTCFIRFASRSESKNNSQLSLIK